jgi:hypothetical protein
LAAKVRHDRRVPFDRALSFFNPLLRRAVPIVEGRHALGRPGQIGDDEADPRIKLSGVPLDFRHHSAGLLPTLRLITEAGMAAAHLMRRSTDRRLSRFLFLQDPVCWQSDRVAHAFDFQELVDLRVGEGRVASKT